LKFEVFKKGKIDSDFLLCGAYAFGSDGLVIRRAKIEFKDGVIECKKPYQATSGIALLWPIEGFGRVILPTTCLPEREKPYNLNVEIARAKLMQSVNKREEWSIFDNFGALADISREAQSLFIEAIENLSSPSTASKLADESLRRSIILSEKLAVKQAESFFVAKSSSHGFSRGCLGCRIDPAMIYNSAYMEKLMELFGFVFLPVNWAQIERQKGSFDFSLIDACVSVLSKRKIAICAGPLLCFSNENLPEWVLKDEGEFERVRESAYQFIVKMVSRYSDHIRSWIVVSGMNMQNHFEFNFEQVLEMTRAATMAVKAVSNRVLKIVEISNPWGEYYSAMPGTIPPVMYIDMLLQGGISFDAFGFRLQFGKNQDGMRPRDMMEISAILDKFTLANKALYITGLEIPSENVSGDGELAGQWHGQWNDLLQSRWLEQFYKIALSKPFIDSVVYSNLIDNPGSEIPKSGLMTEGFEPKRSYLVLKRIHEIIFNR